ncbi:ImuA family protein [Jhaorihella thermophila]|uniref:Protein ImuA n=1 Tax=Jhaorihella thermophila TaxID=488547 RepID=A0A1H5SMQ1_9RHOB|nr:hypothetical protein [Jhaorihella thermophila]SEF51805.1 protein ImuA [Jhaorihella thermophila]
MTNLASLSIPDSLRPEQDPPAGIGLRPARVHEACGPARHAFALWMAGQGQGTVLWIAPAWAPERLHADGMRPLVDPARFLFVHPRRAPDLLWCAEEALRSGAVGLVVADLPGYPALTPVRRLQLAAESSGAAPVGLLLTPGEGGARGVESRWHMAPAHEGRRARWWLERRRARTAPPRRWLVRLSRHAGGEDGRAWRFVAETARSDIGTSKR